MSAQSLARPSMTLSANVSKNLEIDVHRIAAAHEPDNRIMRPLMRHLFARVLQQLLVTLVFTAAAVFDAVAQTSPRLVLDTFTGPNQTRLAAHPPDVNQPGGTWTLGTLGPFPDARSWGLSTDTPVPGDYDGEIRRSIARRPASGRS